MQVFAHGAINDPSENADLLMSMWSGMIKAAIRNVHSASHSEHVTVQKLPEQTVFVEKSFPRVGSFVLAPLTRHVNFLVYKDGKKPLIPAGVTVVGECFETPVGTFVAYIKPDIAYPKSRQMTGCASSVKQAFIVPYWACKQVHDESKTNCEKSEKTVNIKIGSFAATCKVPTITNCKPIKEGDEIFVATTKSEAADEEPALKKQRTDKGGKGKGGKGKQKANAKAKAK